MSIKMPAVILAALVFALDANAIIGHRVQGRPTDAKLISEGGAAEQKAKNATEKLEKKRSLAAVHHAAICILPRLS